MAMSSSPENAQDEAPEENEPDVTFHHQHQEQQQQHHQQEEDGNDDDENDEKSDDRNENNEKHEQVDQHHEKEDKGEAEVDDDGGGSGDDGDGRSEMDDDDANEKSENEEGNDAKEGKSGKRAGALKTDPAASANPAALISSPPGYPYYYGAAPGYTQQKNISYSDVSGMVDPIPDPRRNRGGVSEPFPEKLHRMLDTVEREGLSEVVGFFSHGRAFAIHKQRRFVNDIMPRFFRQSKLTSFQRQLNLYGFRRLSQGPDNGGYYHELFLKGRSGLCVNMKRVKVKGDLKVRRDPDSEPNFYSYPPVEPSPHSMHHAPPPLQPPQPPWGAPMPYPGHYPPPPYYYPYPPPHIAQSYNAAQGMYPPPPPPYGSPPYGYGWPYYPQQPPVMPPHMMSQHHIPSSPMQLPPRHSPSRTPTKSETGDESKGVDDSPTSGNGSKGAGDDDADSPASNDGNGEPLKLDI